MTTILDQRHDIAGESAAVDPPRPRRRRAWVGWLLWPIKFALGVVLCQHPLGALFVVGWSQNMMQRAAVKSWWRRSESRQTGATADDFRIAVLNVPTKGRRRWRWVAPIWHTWRRGLATALNVLVVTLPATALWVFAWSLGWNNSFFKHYEQSHLGFVIGVSGILIFSAVMLYLPIARARQATTGDWRTFYDFRFNWRLVRLGSWEMLGVAILFALASMPVMILRIAPYFLGSDPALAGLSDEELRERLGEYFLFSTVIVIPLYFLVWRIAATAYARAVVRGARRYGPSTALVDIERRAIASVLAVQDAPNRGSTFGGILRGGIRLPVTTLLLGTAYLTWSAVAVQIFVGQFFNYVPVVPWMNHPLVLLPWLRYFPAGL